MGSGGWGWIVPDGLWDVVEPLLPTVRVRPQGGGTANLDDEAVFAAVVYVLTTGCAWRHLPPCFGLSKSTVHRRFTIWTRDGLWGRLRRAMLEHLAAAEVLDVSGVIVDSVHVRAKNGVSVPAPAPSTAASPAPTCTSCPTVAGCPSSSASTTRCGGSFPAARWACRPHTATASSTTSGGTDAASTPIDTCSGSPPDR
jgi:transposase